MVTSEKWLQRTLHTVVSGMRGKTNSCLTQKKDGSFSQKIDYKSQPTAAKSALKLTEKWGKPFDAYKCWYCNGWHIGGAANLTFGKVLSIALIWVLGKKRTGNKHRLKFYRRVKEVECQRCHKQTLSTIMSMYSTEDICEACKNAESLRPDYVAAVEADRVAIKNGDYKFKGIGLN